MVSCWIVGQTLTEGYQHGRPRALQKIRTVVHEHTRGASSRRARSGFHPDRKEVDTHKLTGDDDVVEDDKDDHDFVGRRSGLRSNDAIGAPAGSNIDGRACRK
jgi:hypothetical protein